MESVIWILEWLFGAGVLAYIWYLHDSIQNSKPLRIGYVASNAPEVMQLLEAIIAQYVEDSDSTILIEAGAGKALVAKQLASRYQWKAVVALELSWVLLILGWLGSKIRRNSIQFIHTDVTHYRYPKGALVYCYLYQPILAKMYERGLLKGTLVVSVSFAIPKVTPTHEFQLNNWQQRLIVYDFRERLGA